MKNSRMRTENGSQHLDKVLASPMKIASQSLRLKSEDIHLRNPSLSDTGGLVSTEITSGWYNMAHDAYLRVGLEGLQVMDHDSEKRIKDASAGRCTDETR